MKVFIKILFVFACIFYASVNLCLSQAITIVVKNTDNSTLPGAVVQLTRLPDSAKQSNITNTTGVVHFNAKINTSYLIKISYLGLKTVMDTLPLQSEVFPSYHLKCLLPDLFRQQLLHS